MTTTRGIQRGRPSATGHRLLGARLPTLRRLGVVADREHDVREPLGRIARWSRLEHVQVAVGAGAVRWPLPTGVDPVPDTRLARRCDVLLALGGDAALLRALGAGAVHGVPVLGVQHSRVSELAGIDTPALGAALDALAARRFAIEERTMLTVRNGAATATAVNDVVLRRAPGEPAADLELRVRGDEIARYRGEGVIIATATGSTGPSLMAGGPRVSPALAATIVTPLAARDAPSRPIVLSAGEPVELRVDGAGPQIAVAVDGHERLLARLPARLLVAQSGPRCRLVRVAAEPRRATAS